MMETVEDIIAEMRERAEKWIKDEAVSDMVWSYADRLEDALRGEVDENGAESAWPGVSAKA